MLTVLTPVMLFMSVMLAVSNIWLIRHEGRRPVNTLGIIFAVLWGVGMTFTLGGIIFLLKIPNHFNGCMYNFSDKIYSVA